MFKSIINGFISNLAGKLYLTAILILIISNIIVGANNNLYYIGTAAVILYVAALIYYSRYKGIKIWVMILHIGLTLLPMGVWLTLFYFSRKNYYTYKSED